jgi:hypothetical protein
MTPQENSQDQTQTARSNQERVQGRCEKCGAQALTRITGRGMSAIICKRCGSVQPGSQE